jgi:hypothetical protein
MFNNTVVPTDNVPLHKIFSLTDNSITLDAARQNTLFFIAGITVLIALLVLWGYVIQGWKGKRAVSKLGVTALVSVLALTVNANAFCPVCTVAVGAGLGLSKALGIDDVISGIWVGGLTFSMAAWTVDFLTKRKIKFLFRKPLVLVLMYALVLIPLQMAGIIGAKGNTMWGMDKVVLGTIIGTAGFIGGMLIHDLIYKKNQKKVFFPFQKVAITLLTLDVISLIFYFILYH